MEWQAISKPKTAGLTDLIKILKLCKQEFRKSLSSHEASQNPTYLQLRQAIHDLQKAGSKGKLNCSSGQRKVLAGHFKVLTGRGYVSILPNELAHVGAAVRKKIGNHLFSYIEDFKGVWIGFDRIESAEDENTKTNAGFMTDGDASASIVIPIRCRCLVFRPKMGTKLLGQIKLVRNDAVVLNSFNVADIMVPMSDETQLKTIGECSKKTWFNCMVSSMRVQNPCIGDDFTVEASELEAFGKTGVEDITEEKIKGDD